MNLPVSIYDLTTILDKEESAITTIMIRGSTDNIMDDMERAINDGVNTFKALTRVCHILAKLQIKGILFHGGFFLW